MLPKEGRKEHKGVTNNPVNMVFITEDFFIFISLNFMSFCFGSFSFLIIEVSREEEPNKPVSNGNKDSFKLRFKVVVPKNPASRKIINEARDFSLINKYKDVKSKRKNITNFR